MKKKRYSLNDDIIIIKTINKNPENLHKCFMICAEKLNRDANAISNYWYRSLSKKPSTKAYFYTGGPQSVFKNRKSISNRNTVEPIAAGKTIINKIFNLVNKLFK